MLRFGKTLLLTGIVMHALLLCSSTAYPESGPPLEFRGPQKKSNDIPRKSEILTLLHEVDDVFAHVEQADFPEAVSAAGTSTNPTNEQKRRKRRSAASAIRQSSYDIPPEPTAPGTNIIPAQSNDQPELLDEHSTQLFPIPAETEQAPCDNCEPLFGGVVRQNCPHEVSNWSPLAQWCGIGCHDDPNYCSDIGIGHERVMFAPFEIDVTQPTNFTMLRWDNGFGLKTPDRGEYFYKNSNFGGPASPNSINYADMRYITELGSSVFSVQTEIPLRFIESSGGYSGIGDMKVATKARLVNGKKWQITQLFRTYIPTGSAKNGTGTGRVSLEPGLLARYEIGPGTYFHGQGKILIPIAGDPGFASNVLTSGVGISHVLYETNNFAVIPDLELVNYGFLTGRKTLNGSVVDSGSENAFNIVKGVRFVIGPKGDLGLFEVGISNMIGVGGNRYVNDMLRLDFKFIY